MTQSIHSLDGAPLEMKFPVAIDGSNRTDYLSCPKKFYWRHILGLQSRGVNIHLNAGGAYAKGLEVFRMAYFGEKLPFEDARADGVLAIIIAYGDPEFDPSEAKQWHNVIDAYLSYLTHWNPEFDYITPHMFKVGDGEEPAVEFNFLLPVGDIRHPDTGDPILYSGRFDMLADYAGQVFVEDDKTTSRLGPTWSQQWELRSQFTGYCWGAREFGHQVAGAIIRGTAILKTKITHAEAIVYRPDFMVDRWFNRLLTTTHEMTSLYHGLCNYPNQVDESFPNYGEENGACDSYGGCAYRQLCQSNDPSTWISAGFEVHRWDPTNPEGK